MLIIAGESINQHSVFEEQGGVPSKVDLKQLW